LKVNLFKLKKNKRFNYNPRYLEDNSIDNVYDFDSVYSKQRNSRSSADISSKWSDARISNRNRSNTHFSKRIFFIVLILILVFLFIIDFDISIF
tara:strand:+ start:371 stop:652 length:282 start_codon:yes stop_codon:yes gene_type:complete